MELHNVSKRLKSQMEKKLYQTYCFALKHFTILSAFILNFGFKNLLIFPQGISHVSLFST